MHKFHQNSALKKFNRQTSGTAMGSTVPTTDADIFMERLVPLC